MDYEASSIRWNVSINDRSVAFEDDTVSPGIITHFKYVGLKNYAAYITAKSLYISATST